MLQGCYVNVLGWPMKKEERLNWVKEFSQLAELMLMNFREGHS